MVSRWYAGRLGSAPAGVLFVLAYVVGSLVFPADINPPNRTPTNNRG